MNAVDRYDPERGYRFSTYATHWIRQTIGRAIGNKARGIRLPAHITESIRRVERTRVALAREFGREPTIEEIATKTELPTANEALEHETVPVSPESGVVHDQPDTSAMLAKVVPTGSVSLHDAFAAASGPLLVTVMV